jgi:CBS domain-containing protein
MESDAAGICEDDTLRQAGHRMRELGVTTLPVYGAGGRPQGVVSRDMIVRRIAAGGDPKLVTVAELAPGTGRAPRLAAGGGQAALVLPQSRDLDQRRELEAIS